jgi:gliding motility-associated-like protein
MSTKTTTTTTTLLLLFWNVCFSQTTLILQPGAAAGKDAYVHGEPRAVNVNYGNNIQFPAKSWTYQGTPGWIKSLVEFDLNSIPANAVISSAALSLYAMDYAAPEGQHSTLSGPNEAWLERITSAWDEFTVTWNTQPATTAANRLSLPASTGVLQDYLNMDVTLHIQDMVSNPSGNFGFMLRLKSDVYYRSLNFCSSDHAKPGLRPKLVITYTVPVYTVVLCEGESRKLDSKAAAGSNILWSTGETSASIIVDKAGKYWVEVTKNGITFPDTFNVKVGKKFIVYLGNDTSFCGAFSHLLDAGRGAKKYNWNTGDTTVTILVNQQGMYAVAVKDSNSCPAGDTIQIKKLELPVIAVNKAMDCRYVYLTVARQSGVKYLWSTGDTGITVSTDKKGKFTVKATGIFCSNTQTIEVDDLPLNYLDLGPDILTCEENSPIILCPEGERFLWNTGDTSASITVTAPGKYWVTATEHNCLASDTIVINFFGDCGLTYFVPNAFTPNEDNLNELFMVTGDNISRVDMHVYNRWGQLIFSGSGKNVAWDGTYNGQPCGEGVYFYMISVSGTQKRKLLKRDLYGSLSLLR